MVLSLRSSVSANVDFPLAGGPANATTRRLPVYATAPILRANVSNTAGAPYAASGTAAPVMNATASDIV